MWKYINQTDISSSHRTESPPRSVNSFPAGRYALAKVEKLELEELDTRKDMALKFLFTRRDRVRESVDLDLVKRESGKDVVGYICNGGGKRLVCDVSLHLTADMRIKISGC